MLPKTSAYVKRYGRQTKWMYFLIEDDELLQKYITWDTVSADVKKNLSTIKNFSKQKIKHNDDEVTQFNNKEILKVGSDHTC